MSLTLKALMWMVSSPFLALITVVIIWAMLRVLSLSSSVALIVILLFFAFVFPPLLILIGIVLLLTMFSSILRYFTGSG